jgi:hypothetical protein
MVKPDNRSRITDNQGSSAGATWTVQLMLIPAACSLVAARLPWWLTDFHEIVRRREDAKKGLLSAISTPSQPKADPPQEETI